MKSDAQQGTLWEFKGKWCVCNALYSGASSTPWCYGDLRAMQSHLHSRQGCASHTPKPSCTALDPGTTVQVSKQSPRRIQAGTLAPVPRAITLPLPHSVLSKGFARADPAFTLGFAV